MKKIPLAGEKIAKSGCDFENFISPSLFWILAFVFCCLQALMVQKLVLPLVPSLHAGHGLLVNDAIIFHDTAVNIADLIRTIGWSEWSLYPTGFSGNVGILSALYAVFGPDPAVFIPLNAAAHVTGALMLYLIGPLLWPGSVGRLGGLIAAILFAAFPSTLLWYSQNHKDAFTIAGSLTMLYAWLLLLGGKCVYRSALHPLFLAVGGMAVVLLMRPYLSILLATGFILSWFFCFALSHIVKGEWRSNLVSWAIACFLLLACLGGLFATILPASEGALSVDVASSLTNLLASELPASEGALSVDVASSPNNLDKKLILKVIKWKWEYSDFLPHWVEAPFRRISELRAHFIAHGLFIGAGSGIDQEFMPATIWQALVYFPRALFVGTLVPYPTMWFEHASAPRLATACETFVWYLLAGGVFVLIYRRPTFPLIAGLVFCLFLIVIYSYVSPNIGTLYRVRFGFWMFLLLCGIIGWCSLLLPFMDRITGEPSARRSSNNKERTINGLAAAGSIALIITFVAFLGFFARDLLLISFRGIGGDLDAFFSAAMLPMVFVSCLSMPMADAMTKSFLSFYMKGDVAKSATIVKQFLMIGIFAASTAILAMFFLAKEAVGLVLGTADKQAIAQGALYLRILAPIIFFSVWTVLGNSVLNGIHKSTQAALAQLIVPVCAVGAILAVRQDHTLLAAAVGMLIGTFLNASVLIFLCARNGIWMWPFRLRGCFCEVELKSYVWLVFAAIFTALIVPFNYYFAGTVGQGSVTAWAFASKIVVLFSSLFAFGVTAVVLPHLAAKFEKADNTSGINHFFFLLIAGTWIGGLVVIALSIFAEPMVYALFASDGQVTEHQMAILIRILRIGALQVPVAIAGAIIIKSAAISGASGRAVFASFLGLASNIAGNFFLVPRLGLEGIAIGALVAIIVSTIFLCISTRKSYGTSLSVSAILLFGWCLWIGFAWAIDLKNNLALAGVVFGVFVLAAVHWFSWKSQLHHGSTSRR